VSGSVAERNVTNVSAASPVGGSSASALGNRSSSTGATAVFGVDEREAV